MVTQHSNPVWTWDETVLAYDVLVREYVSGERLPDRRHEPVQDLSQLLQSLPLHGSKNRHESFRNPNSIARKLGNLLYVHTSEARGSANHSRMDEQVVETFHAEPDRLSSITKGIREAFERGELPTQPVDQEEDVEAEEGRLLYRRHAFRERDSRLNRRKKEQVLAATGRLECEVCGFEFEEYYGEYGKGFAEAHHTRPLSNGSRKTRLDDLAIVCSNCHRMLHRGVRCPTVAELAAIVKQSGYASE